MDGTLGKSSPLLLWGKTDSRSWRAARAAAACPTAAGQRLPEGGTVGLVRPEHTPPGRAAHAGRALMGADSQRDTALLAGMSLRARARHHRASGASLEGPIFLDSLCSQGGTVLSPEGTFPTPTSSLLHPPGPCVFPSRKGLSAPTALLRDDSPAQGLSPGL